MTFKHTKFEDSPTMRSLEKLAIDKGLVKENILEKVASKTPKTKPNLLPTSNLTENLLKLCAGLRESGFDAYADELESAFILYKKASKDTKLVEEAHPKGSHKLEGVEGDAVIETILDQQLEDLKIVNKKPTGKLTSANSIIQAVKVSLADNAAIDTDRQDLQIKGKEYLSIGYKQLLEALKSLKQLLPPLITRMSEGTLLGWSTEYVYKALMGLGTERELDRHIQSITALQSQIEDNSDFVIDQYRMNQIFDVINKVRASRDIYAKISWNRFNIPYETKNGVFNAIAQLDRGISWIWAANQKFRGSTEGARWQEQQVTFTDVINALLPMKTHYAKLLDDLKNIDANRVKSDKRAIFDRYINDKEAEKSEVDRVINWFRSHTSQKLRLIHPGQVSDKFEYLKSDLVASNIRDLAGKVSALISANNADYSKIISQYMQ
jgi:hypothetical protein